MERQSVSSFQVERRASLEHNPRVSEESNTDSPETANRETNKRLNKRLLKAIRKFKSCKEIEQAIKDGADVNLKDKNGDFPLMKIDDPFHIYKIVETLIRHNVNVNAQNNEGRTALQFYLERWLTPKMDRVALLLLKAGADMNIKDCYDNTAWHVMVRRGYNYFGRVAEGDNDGEEPGDDHRIFLEILKYQSDINARDGYGRTALHIAEQSKDMDLVRILIERGADPNTADNRGSKPLYEAMGDFDMIEAMLGAGAEVDFSNPSEVSGLHVRLLESDLEFLQLFITPHTINSQGICNRTILHLAAGLGCNQHIEHLLAIPGMDLNANDVFGDTGLHFATQIGKVDTIKAILEAGADNKALNDSRQSIFHVAAIYGYYSLIELFIHEGLSPDATDSQGRNCLHYAVMYRHTEVVQHLLNAGVDPEIKDCKGKRPGDYLLECENGSVIAKMLRGETPVVHVLSADVDPPFDQASQDVPHLADIPAKPGIGSVTKLDGFDMSSFVELIKGKAEELVREAIPECPEIKIIGCGSSFEGSKVVIPDELDFVVRLFKTGRPTGNQCTQFPLEGYEEMDHDGRGNDAIKTDNMSYLVWLWDKLMMWWNKQQESAKSQPGESVPQFQMPLPPQRHPDRTSCITWVWMYNEGAFRDFPVSIDFVPAAKDVVKECFIVPKTPRQIEDPDDSKSRKRGRVSHPPREVKYIRGLDERIRNVYITAKSLRDPDVCGFKIENDDGDLVPVKDFLTSYRLKTAFMHLTPVFQNSDMSHGKMVLMVYETLEKALRQESLPVFFLKGLDVLVGSTWNPERGLLAATKMTKFVRFLYERDFPQEKRMIDSLQEQNVFLRIKIDILMEERKGKVKLPFYLPAAIAHPNKRLIEAD